MRPGTGTKRGRTGPSVTDVVPSSRPREGPGPDPREVGKAAKDTIGMPPPGAGQLRRAAFPHLIATLLLAIVYILAGKLCLSLAVVHPSASAVWAPTGIALAALLRLGYGAWPAIFLGAFAVNVSTAGSIATSLGIAAG